MNIDRARDWRRGIEVTLLLLGCLVGAHESAAENRRLQACLLSLNAPDEVEMFRAHLDRERFELIEFHPRAAGGSAGRDGEWIADACRPDVRCDLLVISGEFAGGFFGTRGSISLQALEEAACDPRCDGLFHHPREVFLMACNTLASKDLDSRTPESYLQVLLEHDFDRGLAERVVELRYGALGPSFRESLRRVFAGVPHLYGFSSVAPRAAFTAPMLERYLHSIPDYAAVLARGREPNPALRRSFAGTSLAETSGLLPGEPETRDRDRICALYDETRSVAERLRIAYGMVLRPDVLRFVPALQSFLARYPPTRLTRVERSMLLEMHAVERAQTAVVELVWSLEVSALQLELAHFAAMVGWLQPEEFHGLIAAGVADIIGRRLTADGVDVLCEIARYHSVRDDFDYDDLPARLYRDPDGVRLIACLAPSDSRVSRRLLPALGEADPVMREWAAYALTQLRPHDRDVLLALVPYLRDPSNAVGGRIRWLFEASSPLPDDVVRAASAVGWRPVQAR